MGSIGICDDLRRFPDPFLNSLLGPLNLFVNFHAAVVCKNRMIFRVIPKPNQSVLGKLLDFCHLEGPVQVADWLEGVLSKVFSQL